MGNAASPAPEAVPPLKDRVIRRWRIEPVTRGRSASYVPTMHPEAKVVKVSGNGRGVALVMDQKAGHISELDDSVYGVTLILVESDTRGLEVDMPEGGRFVGEFFSEHWGVPFMAFAVDGFRVGARRASSGKG